ncbi:COG4315 family predicted lipoprotein [Halosimplex salinum]|uniref:COG4315 family predicted lipoprotein n=1 Tax=Halosimplex salinum TaxID=1710538 RepID=UPI000F49456C|nr:hypothetical protein [Halosimplex salinum]
MEPTRRQVLAATVTTVTLADCGGDDDATETPDDGAAGPGAETQTTETPTETPTESATATPTETPRATTEPATEAADALVRVDSHPDLGEILVDGEGMTLYMFDSDTRGEGASTCYDGCAEAWPPLTVEDASAVSAGSEVSAEVTTFEREDGSVQVAADGWPLYYFASDEEPGDANGQGANDVWWVLRPDGTVVRPDGPETATGDGTETATGDDGAGSETDSDDDGDGYEYPPIE